MRSRRTDPAHEEAVARRLALLTEEMAAACGEPAVGGEWWADHTRPAAPRPELALVPPMDDDVGPPPAGEPPVLPVPGRHARRRLTSPGPSVPASLADLAGRFRPGHIAVVALLVCAALAYTTWRIVRDDAATPVAVSAPTAGEPLGAATPLRAGGAAQPSTKSGTVTVHVAGRVRRPGIVVLDSGARVNDALQKAGGAKKGVDLTSLNLARVLVDGEQILVGVPGARGPVPGPGTTDGTSSAPLVDLNLADQATLETLPGVGPVTATSILAWRTEHGGFTAITELLEVDGIGPATLERLTPLVTI